MRFHLSLAGHTLLWPKSPSHVCPGPYASMQTEDALQVFSENFPTAVALNEHGLKLFFVGITVLFYDWLLTIHDEFVLIWGTTPRLTVAKILFFLSRYYTFLVVLFRLSVEMRNDVITRAYDCGLGPECGRVFSRHVMNWSTVGAWMVTELMILLCVWSLWGRSKLVGIGLLILCVSILGMCIGLKDTSPGVKLAVLEPRWLFSEWGWDPVALFWLFLGGLIVQVVSFTLFFIKTRRHVLKTASTKEWSIGETLKKHCIFYYFLIISLMLLGLISCFEARVFLPLYTGQIMIPFMSLIVSRLTIALREVVFVKQQQKPETGVVSTAAGRRRPTAKISHITTLADMDDVVVTQVFDDMHLEHFSQGDEDQERVMSQPLPGHLP